MSFLKKLFRSKRIVVVTAVLLAMTVAVTACFLWLGDYYPADTAAIEAFSEGSPIPVQAATDGAVVLAPEEATVGFIFYPGGKVEHTAYLPLMLALAEEGVLCVLVEMPFRLAVLDINAADGIREAYPSVTRWYIGGHSLGGAMAASYAAGHAEDLDGLVLLGAYSTSDLSNTDLNVLSVYGSEDRVMNREKYDEYRGNLPADFTETVLEGGCHAGFGAYGPQKGDGTPTMTSEEQIRMTACAIAAMMEQ